MAHLDTAYKIGALAAVDDFTAWLQNDDGNPTEYPKRRGAILKTAQNPAPAAQSTGQVPVMPPSQPPTPPTPPPPTSMGGQTGGRTSTGAWLKEAFIGGRSRAAEDAFRDVSGKKPAPPPPPPPPPKQNAMAPSGGMTTTAADRAVEQVMRKLGKSMSRRPLSREGTKFEALKKKLRKQKPKKD